MVIPDCTLSSGPMPVGKQIVNSLHEQKTKLLCFEDSTWNSDTAGLFNALGPNQPFNRGIA